MPYRPRRWLWASAALLACANPAPAPRGPGFRGIAVPLHEAAVPLFLSNLDQLRRVGCALPVEVWEAGGELSNGTRGNLEALGVRVHSIEGLVPNASEWRGWQIKGAIPSFTSFEELILADADICFARNPAALFDTQAYAETGTYFFRDEQSKWRFFGSAGTSRRCKTCQSKSFYDGRKQWLQGLFGPTMPPGFPPEWAYAWREGREKDAVKEVMDSGVVLVDKRRHPGMLRRLFELNRDKAETYKHVWGDKETFWLAAMLAREPFALHPVEGTHECVSLLAFDTLRFSKYWRPRVVRGMGSKLRGLMQRADSGRALFYHRKCADVSPLSTFQQDWNKWLCDRGWGIEERRYAGLPLRGVATFVVVQKAKLFAAAAGCVVVAAVAALTCTAEGRARVDWARFAAERIFATDSSTQPLLHR